MLALFPEHVSMNRGILERHGCKLSDLKLMTNERSESKCHTKVHKGDSVYHLEENANFNICSNKDRFFFTLSELYRNMYLHNLTGILIKNN